MTTTHEDTLAGIRDLLAKAMANFDGRELRGIPNLISAYAAALAASPDSPALPPEVSQPQPPDFSSGQQTPWPDPSLRQLKLSGQLSSAPLDAWAEPSPL